MRKKALKVTAVVIAFSLCMVLPTQTLASMPTLQEMAKFLGYTKTDVENLMAGEIISRGLEAGTEEELAVTVGMLVRAPLAEVLEFARSGEVFKVNREVIESRDLGDAPSDKNLFADLGLDAKEADEVAKLLDVKAGDKFNFSKAEIDRFKALSHRFQSKGATDKAVREAVNVEYREALMERHEAYREGGLNAIAPYDRGSESSSPGEELTDEANRGVLIREKMPDFYQALVNYPRSGSKDIQNQFFWFKQRVNKRPAFILAHRMYRFKPEEYMLSAFREFYVGHSYNSQHIMVGALPVKTGTVVFYLNRTSTDQVAGFGGSMKRSIGSKMLRKEIIKLFTSYRQSLEKGGS